MTSLLSNSVTHAMLWIKIAQCKCDKWPTFSHACLLLLVTARGFLAPGRIDHFGATSPPLFSPPIPSPPLEVGVLSGLFQFYFSFYSAAALLAMQSAVIPTAIPSVCPSVCLSHAGTLSRRMKIKLGNLHCEIVKHSSFLTPTIIGGDVHVHLKFALKVTHPFWKASTSTNICL